MATAKLAIDFDSAFTNIYMTGGGLVLSEPTVSAVSSNDFSVKVIGEEAKKIIGKTAKNTKIVFPVFEGEIVNEKVATGVLGAFIKKISPKNSLMRSKAIFALPCGYTAEMVDKYIKVAKSCNISRVWFAESPVLSALGQRVPLNDSNPCFVIDMAGGITNIAAVSLDGVIAGVSINYGMNKICSDIIDYIVEKFGIQIGLLTAERLRKEIGSLDESDGLSTIVNGRDTMTGAPRAITLRAVDILPPIKKYYDKVAEVASAVLKKLLPEVSAEIRHAGIYVSGVASEIYGLEKYYTIKFGIPIKLSENARFSVALGGGIVMGNNELLNKVCIKDI